MQPMATSALYRGLPLSIVEQIYSKLRHRRERAKPNAGPKLASPVAVQKPEPPAWSWIAHGHLTVFKIPVWVGVSIKPAAGVRAPFPKSGGGPMKYLLT